MTVKTARRRAAVVVAGPPPWWGWASGAAGAALATAMVFRLAPQAGRAKLFSDECFHAYLAEWIGAHGRLPDRLPEFYSGLWYSYPPLLHLLGAAWLKLFSLPTIVELNVVLFALLLAAIAFLPVPGIERAPRRWAVLLCVANAWLASYSVRFFAEMLISLLAVLVVLLLLRHHRTGRTRDAVLAGIGIGLALLAKQTAMVLPALVLAFAAGAWIGRRPRQARDLVIATLIGVAMAAPFFIRNARLYGSPIYPALARDVDRELLHLYQLQPGYTVMTYLGECYKACGPFLIAFAAAALVLAALRRRGDVTVLLLALCPLGVALNFLSPLHDARHIIPMIAVTAILGSVLVYEALRARTQIVVAVEVGLIALALIAVVRLKDIRSPFDVLWFLPPAYEAAPSVVPEDATILSLFTYDTYFYTRRKATWPLAWGPVSSMADLFRETDPDRFLAAARRHGLDYLLVERWMGADQFLGSNYSKSFGLCVADLMNRGKMRAVWMNREMAIVAVNP